MFSKLCAAAFWKMLDDYMSFQPNLSKLNELLVDNVEDRVMLAEKVLICKNTIMTFVATYNATHGQYK